MQISSVETAFLDSSFLVLRCCARHCFMHKALPSWCPQAIVRSIISNWLVQFFILVVNRSDLWAHIGFIHFSLCHEVGTVRSIVQFALRCGNRNSYLVTFLKINGQHLASAPLYWTTRSALSSSKFAIASDCRSNTDTTSNNSTCNRPIASSNTSFGPRW
jgi:hypothetical protein